MGEQNNRLWAERLQNTYSVHGYWPAILMHYINARATGDELPTLEELQGFGKDMYMFDRSLIYRWSHADIWNIAMPANVAKAGLHYFEMHEQELVQYSPDVIILCLGSVDCLEHTPARTIQDFNEIKSNQYLDHSQSTTFDYCDTAEEFHEVLSKLSEKAAKINKNATIINIDILKAPNISPRIVEKINSFSSVIRDISRDHGQHFISLSDIFDRDDYDEKIWFMSDRHPTELMNKHIAMKVLDCIPFDRQYKKIDNFPVKTLDIKLKIGDKT
ncbi:hypothetical protein WH50_12575 [Pokkaliibacter plantistimulans]|uniref:SGNH hydrolase-type esterase domain-containing protein n=2 Tax=Pokkaliibacter plantistimulans TaxID=1635171 RepID=A0ABX5LZ86_9GAMM|nr:hypothetical protein WH50_12575 [Pokkaliibacter plantistimulans]